MTVQVLSAAILKGYSKVRKFVTRREEGATLVEYALLLALIAVLCIGVITALGQSVQGLFGGLSETLDGVDTNAGAAP